MGDLARRTSRTAVLSAIAAALATTHAAAQPAAPHLSTGWQSGAVCYEVFVRSFADSDGDGIGDLNGLTAKLDYINDGDPAGGRDLGAACIWLMPVAESPSYHGYDVSDYTRVEPDYGTNEDFRRLVAEAHRRGIRVLVDMVLNHSSSQHPWFVDAARGPASPRRDWYVWLPTHPGVRNPWGGDNWHRSPVRDEYFYGFFWSGMPDLNLRNRAVVEETKRIATFWLREMGVDGFRLDAVKFLVEADSGRTVEHLPATHAYLREYAAHVRGVKPGAFTIGEVWDSTGAMLPYYPDGLDAYFAFDLSDDILEAVKTGTPARLLPGYLRLQRTLPAGRWAPFLRNHDQTRTMTALGGDAARARMAAALLLTLPGLPFLYYGEEIGMSGDKPDERLRTPMQWSRAAAAGFTSARPWQELQADWRETNVALQEDDPGSLLNLHRRLVHLRGRHPALAEGELVPLSAGHPRVAAYLRRSGGRAVLVVANLGTSAASGVALDSGDGALPRGRYRPVDLLNGRAAAPLAVSASGAVRGFVPVQTLGPLEFLVLELNAPLQPGAAAGDHLPFSPSHHAEASLTEKPHPASRAMPTMSPASPAADRGRP